MANKKYKHLSYDDRCIIQQFITFGRPFSDVSNRIHKDRTTISKEVKTHRYSLDKGKRPTCLKLKKPPYVCNACEARPHCKYQRFLYDAAIAHSEYRKTLSIERASVKLSKELEDLKMYLKKSTKASTGRTQLSIVEGYRDENKIVRTKTIKFTAIIHFQ